MSTSNAIQVFRMEAPLYADAWMNAVRELEQASKLDKKIEELAYIAVLAATRLTSGIPFHVESARKHGATREEIIGAVLVGLPAAGNAVIQALPIALDAFDEQSK
jgi:AhpD family alkylhydroperoxidase